jgi:hypothetical protein
MAISPGLFLTSGHCTDIPEGEDEDDPADDLPTWASFDQTFDPQTSELITGTAYTHP